MGLFDFLKKKEKQVVVPEPNNEAVDWFFTEEAKLDFEINASNEEEMLEVWFSPEGKVLIEAYTAPKGTSYRRDDFPATFFADYLRALKTTDMGFLAIEAWHLALGDEVLKFSYPDCLKAEYNPLINFAIKIKPMLYHKNGKRLEYNLAMKSMIAYLHDCYVDNYIDESNEEWIYEENLWFDSKGKERNSEEIVADIKEKVRYKEIVRVYRS